MEMRFGSNNARLWRIAFPRKKVGVAAEPQLDVPEAGAIFKAYPNPFSNHVTIGLILDRPELVETTFVDVMGRVVHSSGASILQAGEHKTVVSTGDLAPGTYLVSVRIGETISSRVITLIR